MKTLATTSNDALMGAQLTDQYHRAVGGMREVLKFGAMMIQLREHLATVVQVRTTAGQFGEKEQGSIKRWISDNAPDVKPGTAFRFMHVAEAVAAQFKAPAKISFVDLATKPAEELPEKFREKQLELFEFIEGTSQRSWLDHFKPRATAGGYRPRKGEPPSIEDIAATARFDAETVFQRLVIDLESFFLSKRNTGYELLGDADKSLIRGLVLDVHKSLRK